MGVAIRIYLHVGKEFKVFGQIQQGSSTAPTSVKNSVDFDKDPASMINLNTMRNPLDDDQDHDEVAPDDVRTPTKSSRAPESGVLRINGLAEPDAPGPPQSSQSWSLLSPDWQSHKQHDTSNPSSRRGSQQIAPGVTAEDFAPPSQYDFNQHRGSVTTAGSGKSLNTQTTIYTRSNSILPSIREKDDHDNLNPIPQTPTNSHNLPAGRHRAIQRQLRLLFIYPVIYMLMWIIPFVVHCLNYSDYFAQHPIFALSALNTFCQTFMGFTDVAIFCWREQPWRHIPGSDGSFAGSFRFWRFCSRRDRDERRASRAPHGTPGFGAGKNGSKTAILSQMPERVRSLKTKQIRPLAHLRSHSRGSDRRQMELERARERLALERADWRKSQQALEAKRSSAISMQSATGGAAPPCPNKEWWDTVLADDEAGYGAEDIEEETCNAVQ